MLEKIFKLKEKNTDVKTEIIAGITTFLAMAYILFVNPSILAETGMSFHGVFFATAIASAFASILMGLLANYPVALSSGMGVNAFFAYTVVLGMGYSYEAALAAVFVSGIIFIAISVTGLRRIIINSIPKNMKLAIGAGIGFFIAFIGFKNAGIIIANPATFVSLGTFKNPVVLLAVIGLFITVALLTKKVPAAVFWGLVATTLVGIGMNLAGLGEGLPTLPNSIIAVEFDTSLIGAFARGFGELFSNPVQAIVIIFSFLFIANPIFTGISLVVMTALSFICVGISAIVLAFQLKKLKTLPGKLRKELKDKIEDLKEEYYNDIKRVDD